MRFGNSDLRLACHYKTSDFVFLGAVKSGEDWKIDGKPFSKPVFKACGIDGCQNGYIFPQPGGDQTVKECVCKVRYNREFGIDRSHESQEEDL